MIQLNFVQKYRNIKHTYGWNSILSLLNHHYSYDNTNNSNDQLIEFYDFLDQYFIQTNNAINLTYQQHVYKLEKRYLFYSNVLKIYAYKIKLFNTEPEQYVWLTLQKHKWYKIQQSLDTFVNCYAQSSITNKWIGCIHHTPTGPSFYQQFIISTLLSNPLFIESLLFCKGLIVFSTYLKDYLLKQPLLHNIPIYVLYHPYITTITIPQSIQNIFSIELSTSKRTLLQIGFWLKNNSILFHLPHELNFYYNKKWLMGNKKYATQLYQSENIGKNIQVEAKRSMVQLITTYLPYDEYLHLMSQSIILVEYYDISCSNVLIEAICNSIPIICNAHPAVIEYIGHNYPLLYHNQEELYQLLYQITQSSDLLMKTYNYYQTNTILFERLQSHYFLHDFQEILSSIN